MARSRAQLSRNAAVSPIRAAVCTSQQLPTNSPSPTKRCFFCCSDDSESSECGDSEAEGRDQASPTDTGRGAASSEHESPSDDEEPPAASDGNGQNAELDTFGFGHDSDSNGEDDGKISERKQTSPVTPAAPPNAQMVVCGVPMDGSSASGKRGGGGGREWACTRCTLHNAAHAVLCRLCAEARPLHGQGGGVAVLAPEPEPTPAGAAAEAAAAASDLPSRLPYGGDAQAATRQENRDAIRAILAARDRARGKAGHGAVEELVLGSRR